MNITVNVTEVALDTVVAEVFGYDQETGEPFAMGPGKTVADLVAAQIVDRLVKDDRWPSLAEKVREIRSEVIREAIRPSVDEAIAAPVVKTNTWGEATGKPTSLREVVIDEARKLMNEPVDRYAQAKGTYLTKAVRDEVQAALKAEIAEAVKQVREQVSAEAGALVAAAVTNAMRGR